MMWMYMADGTQRQSVELKGDIAEPGPAKVKPAGRRERWRGLSPMDGLEGAVFADAWGFPRSVTAHEIEKGLWFEIPGEIVVWLEPVEGVMNVFGIHLAVNPTWRGHLNLEAGLQEMLGHAREAAGQEGLLVVFAEGQFDHVRSLVKSLGFEFDKDIKLWTKEF